MIFIIILDILNLLRLYANYWLFLPNLVKISQLGKNPSCLIGYITIQKCQTRNFNTSIASLFTKEKGFI